MAEGTRALSLTRPRDPRKEYGRSSWQFSVGLAVAGAGLMSLMALFIISAVVAGWVSGVTDPSEANTANLLARVSTYDAWLFPVATASVAMVKVGIAVILWGIVRRLWVRVESVKESLPALMGRGSEAPS